MKMKLNKKTMVLELEPENTLERVAIVDCFGTFDKNGLAKDFGTIVWAELDKETLIQKVFVMLEDNV
jgi:hypothetical protein